MQVKLRGESRRQTTPVENNALWSEFSWTSSTDLTPALRITVVLNSGIRVGKTFHVETHDYLGV